MSVPLVEPRARPTLEVELPIRIELVVESDIHVRVRGSDLGRLLRGHASEGHLDEETKLWDVDDEGSAVWQHPEEVEPLALAAGQFREDGLDGRIPATLVTNRGR